MKLFAKSALVGLLLALTGAAQASTDECATLSPQTHEVLVLKNGYFPSILYACPGDTVTFVNNNTLWVSFDIVAEGPSTPTTIPVNWFKPWASVSFSIPTGFTRFRLEDSELYFGVNQPETGYIELTPAPNGK